MLFRLAVAGLMLVFFGSSSIPALERPDVAFKSLLISAAVTCSAGLWLVKGYGPAGVAWGLLAGNVSACVFTRIVFARQVHMRLQEGRVC